MEYETRFCLKKKQRNRSHLGSRYGQKMKKKKHRKAKKRHNEVLSLSILNTKKLTTIEDMQVTSQR